ncbi:hypothetical protein BP00DRAFT_220827 [Aspergillus indologenus CBS 114.80]|uniref:Uncharacterized protein n=1 Tax=Aspergillus indologenus CBS 114.80 TaxID=1450541 RepID=A0A2V5I753_9EURO|nr:hypothetical protein BP00DRAFT_220827 [Aspergillus indologenus CBS 114.80]
MSNFRTLLLCRNLFGNPHAQCLPPPGSIPIRCGMSPSSPSPRPSFFPDSPFHQSGVTPKIPVLLPASSAPTMSCTQKGS